MSTGKLGSNVGHRVNFRPQAERAEKVPMKNGLHRLFAKLSAARAVFSASRMPVDFA
jgi:hypothetical protein